MIPSLLQPYLDAVLSGRDWSWALVAILYVLAGCFVRGWFTGAVTGRLAVLEKPLAQTVKSHYLKYSVLGWIFFFVPILIIVLVWRKDILPWPVNNHILIFTGLGCFILAILLHLQAYAIAAVLSLRQASEEFQKKRYDV